MICKDNRKYNDAIYASVYLPLFPGDGVNLAYQGHATLTDNYGNILEGHELYINMNNGTVRHYHLTDEQAEDLYYNQIAPHAKSAGLRLDNKIPILFQMESPIKEEGDELASQNVPFALEKSRSKVR